MGEGRADVKAERAHRLGTTHKQIDTDRDTDTPLRREIHPPPWKVGAQHAGVVRFLLGPTDKPGVL